MTAGLASDLGDQREACCNKASYNARIVSTKLFPPCFTSSVGALFIPVGTSNEHFSSLAARAAAI
jgi:hypothetical protein